MDFKVIWDDEATAELGQIIRYISKDNPLAVRKIGEKIFEKANLLGSFPQLGKTFQKLNRADVREISVTPYRIIYHVKTFERSVRILKIWHSARQEPEIQ